MDSSPYLRTSRLETDAKIMAVRRQNVYDDGRWMTIFMPDMTEKRRVVLERSV
jgi:hypothetical protein